MKKLLLIAVLILFPFHAQAFDYHGIKAGMSKDQVSEALKALGGSPVQELLGSVSSVAFRENLKGFKWSPRLFTLEYDHEDRLYVMNIAFHSPSSNGPPTAGVPGTAFKSAFEKKYGAIVEIEPRSSTPFYTATLVDEKRLARYLDHLIKETMAGI